MAIVIKRVIYMLAAGLLIMLAVGLIVYGFKERLTVYLVNQQLSDISQVNNSPQAKPMALSLDCLSFDINLFKESNHDTGNTNETSLEIERVCVTLNNASVTLSNIELVWQHSDFSLSKLSDKQYWLANLKGLTIEQIDLIGTPAISSANSQVETTYQQFIERLETSARVIFSHVEQLSQLTLLDVKQLRFQPQRNQTGQAYLAEIKYAKQSLPNSSGLSSGSGLLTAKLNQQGRDQGELFSTKITVSPKALAGEFSSNLAKLKSVVASLFQQTKFQQPKLQQLLDDTELNGLFTGEFNWPILNQGLTITDLKASFSLKNTQIKLAPEFLAELAEAVTVTAALNLQTEFTDNGVDINFVGANIANQITLDVPASWQQQSAAKALLPNSYQQLVDIVQANQLVALSLGFNERLRITWLPNGVIGSFDKFELATLSAAFQQQTDRVDRANGEVLAAKFSKLIYQAKTPRSNSQLNSNLAITGSVVVPQLAELSKAPIEFMLANQLVVTEEMLNLDFSESSKLALSSLSIPDLAEIKGVQQAVQGAVEVNFAALANSADYIPTLDFKLSTTIGDAQISAKAREAKTSDIGVSLVNARLESSVKADSAQALDVQAQFSLAELDLAQVEISGDYLTPSIVVQQQSIALVDLLNKLTLSLPEEITPELVEGQFSYHLTGQVKSWQQLLDSDINGQFAIEQLTGRVKKYWLEGLHYQQGFRWQNRVLQSETSTENSHLLTVDLLDLGIEIKALTLQPEFSFAHQQQNWQGKLSSISGQAFNGEFSLAQLEWPIEQEQTLALSFDGFDLSELIALENQQGINVTGQVSGQVPLYLAEKDGKLDFSVSDGNLFNITNGVIQIKDNPAVEQFKLNHQQLAIAFEALENLHYNQLSAQVNMDNQGQMLLVTSIKGRNPDLDNEVNLNLNLDYDLLGLLESLQIPEQLEQRISDRLAESKVN